MAEITAICRNKCFMGVEWRMKIGKIFSIVLAGEAR